MPSSTSSARSRARRLRVSGTMPGHSRSYSKPPKCAHATPPTVGSRSLARMLAVGQACSVARACAGLGRLCGGRAVGVPGQLPRRGDARRGALRADPLRRCAAARRCRPPPPPLAIANPSTAPFRTGRPLAGARRWPMEPVKSVALVRTAWRLRQAHMALRCVAPSALSWCALSAAGKMRHVHIGTQLLSLFGHAADACAHLQARRERGSLFRRTNVTR